MKVSVSDESSSFSSVFTQVSSLQQCTSLCQVGAIHLPYMPRPSRDRFLLCLPVKILKALLPLLDQLSSVLDPNICLRTLPRAKDTTFHTHTINTGDITDLYILILKS